VARGKEGCEKEDKKAKKLYWGFISKQGSSPKCCNQPRSSSMSFLYNLPFL